MSHCVRPTLALLTILSALALAVCLFYLIRLPLGFTLSDAFLSLAILATGFLDVCLWVIAIKLVRAE